MFLLNFLRQYKCYSAVFHYILYSDRHCSYTTSVLSSLEQTLPLTVVRYIQIQQNNNKIKCYPHLTRMLSYSGWRNLSVYHALLLG